MWWVIGAVWFIVSGIVAQYPSDAMITWFHSVSGNETGVGRDIMDVAIYVFNMAGIFGIPATIFALTKLK